MTAQDRATIRTAAIDIAAMVACKLCDGSGAYDATKITDHAFSITDDCPRCSGTGKVKSNG